ncbi:hypothetical protein PsorP6_003471 [Peronosclerospora sorghi]|uniref:Uncharacterized protein n=1 Tax=Peronosclerospora sorghi TaxID=230839 RepID=A0ACC0VNI9_9STRA|nr:hypothetical protein PsorP6_003471 [Peronosclerospora sorghi]
MNSASIAVTLRRCLLFNVDYKGASGGCYQIRSYAFTVVLQSNIYAQKRKTSCFTLKDVFNRHPAVSDCCCGRGKNKMGEGKYRKLFFVVLKHPDSPDRTTAQEIMDCIAEHMSLLSRRCARCNL